MTLSPGSRVGPYEIIAPLDAGGMGEVYRARDPRLSRDVAIKVLIEGHGADPAHLRRFTIEARAIAALNHPNIITIFDVADADGFPFIAMELVDGETLRDRLLRGALPVREAVDVAIQIAEGLAHAHDARVVHRDLKPRNVMVKPNGLVKILDFGLGKMIGSLQMADAGATTTLGANPTTAGTILGTAGYMSPEQVTGQHVDARSDQFAFGAVLYELLTGCRAFRRDTTIETMSSVLSSDPTPLASLAPHTPLALVHIVERCLRKRAADRYASTQDLVHDLRAAREDLVATRSRSRTLPAGRGVAVAIGAAIAALAVAAVAAVVFMRPQGPALKEIAVLPFTNVQRDASDDAFADGIVEVLTTNLTQLERSNETLRVVPASEVRRYEVSSAREARQAFGANLVVSGSIQRMGDTVRLTVNLIDPASLQQRSARVIDARADNALALEDQAFAVLADMLGASRPAATTTTLHVGGTLVPSAYDYYVQGRGYLQRYEQKENVESAIDLFRRAVQQDERFAVAHAALGEALWRKYELVKDASLIAEARAACAKAIAIDDRTAAVHITLSLIARGTGEYETAVAEANRALALDRASPDAWRELARSYEALGQFDRAETTYKEAIAARPGDWTGHNALGAFYAARRRYPDALASFQRVTELTPDNAMGYSNMGGIQFFLGQYDAARVSFERSVALKPTYGALSNLGTLDFRLKRYDEAARAFERAVALDGSDYRVWGNLADAYARSRDRDKARAAYTRAEEAAEREREINPRRPALLADLSIYYAASDRPDLARTRAREAMTLAPDDASVMVSLGVAFDVLGDKPAAVDWLMKALDAGYPADQIKQRQALSDLLTDPRLVARLNK